MGRSVKQLLALFIVATAASATVTADAGCSKGDSACFCKSIGGTWRALQAPLLPACKVTYQHQGAERYVHVYLPPSYDGVTQWPVWVHLHGVFWATMGDIGTRVGHPVNGTDIIPAFDHSVEMLGDKAILVYPQSTGDAGTGAADEGQGKKYRQFWSIPFWHCSVGICRDASTDDLGFIEQVVVDLPKRLPLKQDQYLLTGESAGGMMVHAILCQSKVIPPLIDAAIDMLGGVGADYMRGPACAGHAAVPFLKLHGIEDPFITYNKDILVDGVNFASSIEGTQVHAKANGCSPADIGPKDVSEADGKMLCTDYCGGNPKKLPAKLCGMPGVGHDTDHPFPGFVYQQSWAWFQQQVAAAAERKPLGINKKLPERDALLGGGAKKSGGVNGSVAVGRRNRPGSVRAGVAVTAPQPLELNITFTGVSVSVFSQADKAAAALAAVAQATGLPAANITVTYHTATLPAPSAAAAAAAAAAGDEVAAAATAQTRGGGSRRLHRHVSAVAAAAEDRQSAVTGRYVLAASEPDKVADSVAAAVQGGSLLQALQQSGLGATSKQGPLVSLATTAAPTAAAAAAGDKQLLLLEPTDLTAAAAEGQGGADVSNLSAVDAAAPTAADATDSKGAATAAAAAAPAPSSSRGGSTAAIVGGVVGAVGGAALLAGGAFWAVGTHKRKQQQQQQQQQQQEQVYVKDQQQQQQRRPAVINLNADAVMCISDGSVHFKA